MRAFQILDADQDGLITRAELGMSIKHLPPELLKHVSADEMAVIFDVLDVDDSNELSQDEFVNGIMRVVMSDASFDSLHNLRLLKKVNILQDKTFVEVKCVQQHVRGIEGCLGNMVGDV